MDLRAIDTLVLPMTDKRYLVCSFDGNELSSLKDICDMETNTLDKALKLCGILSEKYEVCFVYDILHGRVSYTGVTTPSGCFVKKIQYDLIESYFRNIYHIEDLYRVGFIGAKDMLIDTFPKDTLFTMVPGLSVVVAYTREFNVIYDKFVTTYQVIGTI